MTSSRLPINEIVAGLRDQIGELCAELLPGGCRRGRQWRVGSLAGNAGTAIAIELFGAKRGYWFDYRSGQGGDAFDLVAAVLFNGNKRSAIEWAIAWLKLDQHDRWMVRHDLGPQPVDHSSPIRDRRAEAACDWLAAKPVAPGDPVWR